MTIVSGYFRELGRATIDGWNHFWFTPQDPATLGLIRILVGTMLFYTHVVWSLDLEGFFGAGGWLAPRRTASGLRRGPVSVLVALGLDQIARGNVDIARCGARCVCTFDRGAVHTGGVDPCLAIDCLLRAPRNAGGVIRARRHQRDAGDVSADRSERGGVLG
jgi:hypothetical protein